MNNLHIKKLLEEGDDMLEDDIMGDEYKCLYCFLKAQESVGTEEEDRRHAEGILRTFIALCEDLLQRDTPGPARYMVLGIYTDNEQVYSDVVTADDPLDAITQVYDNVLKSNDWYDEKFDKGSWDAEDGNLEHMRVLQVLNMKTGEPEWISDFYNE